MKKTVLSTKINHESSWRHILKPMFWVAPISFVILLIVVSRYSFLAFHTLAELFAVIIAFVMFSLAWSTRSFTSNNFLLFIACGYFWVGSIDLLHALTYKGMTVFNYNDDVPIQLWIAARAEEALILFFAPFASRIKQKAGFLMLAFGAISIVIVCLILTGNFPEMYIHGKGLTTVKIYSEYLIDVILALSLFSLFNVSVGLTKRDKVFIATSIVFTMIAELAFTIYVDVYGLSNLIGHIFKLLSFWLIYNSIIVSNLKTPYSTLHRNKNRFKQLFDNAEISILNEDFSEVQSALLALKKQGIQDLEKHLLAHINLAWELAAKVKVIEVNDATQVLFAAENGKDLTNNFISTFGPDAIFIFIKQLGAIWRGDKVFKSESTFLNFDGAQIDVLISFQVPETPEEFKNMPVSLIDITQRKEAEKRIWQQANFDVLTGLANRHLFIARLTASIELARSESQRVAVLFIDLDRFKNVNDTLGHSLGDSLLQKAATRLLESKHTLDTVARFGGDEFAVLLSRDSFDENEKSTIEIKKIVSQILKDLSAPYILEGHDAFISASIGVTVYPDDGETVETLLRKADSAMYLAKEHGRNNFQFFTKDIDIGALRKRELEKDLRLALEKNQFSLNYQPIVDAKTGSLVSVEALIRWNQPENGPVSPVEFIPLAEEIGLIMPIGEWVLRQACKDAVAWAKLVDKPPKISVNLSGVQFQRQDIPKLVQNVLVETGLPSERLTLEITEGLLLSDDDATLSQFKKIRALGVELSIDDFGTGYSSLSYLKKFPISNLKIDRSFIMNLPSDVEEMALVNAILAMAESLGLKVIAEGVETQAQADFLKERTCQYIQGYFFSKPLTNEDFIVYLLSNAGSNKI